MQTNDKALSFLEHKIDSKKIPSTLIAHLISSKSRRKLLDSNEAQSFLRANPCILKFLDTLHGRPGVLTSHNTLGSNNYFHYRVAVKSSDFQNILPFQSYQSIFQHFQFIYCELWLPIV